MKTNSREILIYYNPESSGDKKTVAHAKGVASHIKTYSYSKAPSTGMSWQMILNALREEPKELLNKAHPYYREHIKGKEFDAECWIKVLKNNPQMIKAPIAVRGNRVILCQNATDIYRLI